MDFPDKIFGLESPKRGNFLPIFFCAFERDLMLVILNWLWDFLFSFKNPLLHELEPTRVESSDMNSCHDTPFD